MGRFDKKRKGVAAGTPSASLSIVIIIIIIIALYTKGFLAKSMPREQLYLYHYIETFPFTKTPRYARYAIIIIYSSVISPRKSISPNQVCSQSPYGTP